MNQNLETQLTELIQNELVKANYELFSLRVYKAGSRQVVSLAIDHATGGITLDECVRWNHWMSDQIEQLNLIPTAYTVEVQSPGLDWPMQAERDFRRMAGKRIAVQYNTNSGVGSTAGRVEDVKDGVLRLRVSTAQAMELPLSAILKAKPDFHFPES